MHRYIPRAALKPLAPSPALLNWEFAASKPALSLISSGLVSLNCLVSNHLLETPMEPRHCGSNFLEWRHKLG